MAALGPVRLLRAAAAASSRRWLFSASPIAGAWPGCGSAAAAVRAARPFSLSARAVLSSEDKITVHFINRDGDKLTAKGKPGDSLLDVVVNNNLDIDGFAMVIHATLPPFVPYEYRGDVGTMLSVMLEMSACEGTLACSTCHLIFEDHIFEKLDAITDEEMDMLDLAYGLTETSRLGCQICLKKSMDNMTVRVPEAVEDVRQSVDMSKNS